MSDWIDDFLDYSSGIPSPDIFHLWVAISTIAASLERRVWVTTARGILYPNLFVALVAPPAVGKSVAIDQSTALATAASAIARQKNFAYGYRFSPIDMTTASLIDALAASTRKVVISSTELMEYASMYIQVGELGVLMPGHDLGFISVLNHLFDNPSSYVQQRRSLKDEINIQRPQLNILAGTQPGFLAATLPEQAWSMGFTSRIIMVYAAKGPIVDLFQPTQAVKEKFNDLAKRLAGMWSLHGEMKWEQRAMDRLMELHQTGFPPTPEHSRLAHYNARRILQLIKICIVSAASRMALVITLSDVERARLWLLDAESRMPDIFREMAGKSDGQVIEELHLFMWRIYAKERRPVHEARMYDFLRTRVPSEKIQRVIEIAEKANVIIRIAGTSSFQPRPQHEHGME